MFNETLAARAGPCIIDGNADLYGLGIRIGIYIQMLAVQISSLLSMVLRQDDYLGEGVVIFILAVGTVLVKLIVEHRIVAVEAAPMIVLLLAQVSVCRSIGRMGLVLNIIYAVEFCGLTALYVWFWWYGMDRLGHSECTDDKVFFFVRVSLWGWFRTMNKVFTVFYALAGAMMAVMYLLGVYKFLLLCLTLLLPTHPRRHFVIWLFRRILGRAEPLSVNHANDQALDDDSRWNVDLEKGLEITVNIGVIVFVEMTLKWNNITNVHTLRNPGQFMPLLIALAQLLAIIYQGVSSAAHLVASEDEPHLDDHDEADCIHDNATKLIRRRTYQAAGQDEVEMA
ncbi:hypothetical protein NQ176_g9740 [Zarea fungicola]|uniref:Uncharacterized protein n=1 Tax=Zarea fungicola TaxID=93591 RepID=A0ACC1MKD7_9HYPO|nr:hypothetical protein NQ176_g9740 [Lecanicillium fungicola]